MPKQEQNLLTEKEMIFSRLIDAPRELVYEAWTKPEHIGEWFGPEGFTTTTHKMDVRPGGEWDFIMHGPDGRDYPNKIMYTETVKPEKLVYSQSGDGFKFNFYVEVTFDDENGKTWVTMRSVFESEDDLKKVVEEYGAYEGGKQNIERMRSYIAKMQA